MIEQSIRIILLGSITLMVTYYVKLFVNKIAELTG